MTTKTIAQRKGFRVVDRNGKYWTLEYHSTCTCPDCDEVHWLFRAGSPNPRDAVRWVEQYGLAKFLAWPEEWDGLHD